MATVLVSFSFPDEVSRPAERHPARLQFLAQEFVERLVPPDQAWKGVFQDVVARPAPLQPPSTAWVVEGYILPPAPVSGRSTYPDRVPGGPVRVEGIRTPDLFPTTVVTFGWKGGYPDFARRPGLQPELAPHSVLGVGATVPVPDPRWVPEVPDWIPKPPRLEAGLHHVWAQNLDPIVNPPAPDLAWGPEYPGYIWALVSVTVGARQATALEPIRPFTPDLSWQVRYPDRAPRPPTWAHFDHRLSFQEPIIAPDIRQDWYSASVDLHYDPRLVPTGSFALNSEIPINPVVWLSLVDALQPFQLQWQRWVGGIEPLIAEALIVIGDRHGWQSHGSDPVYLYGTTADPPWSIQVAEPPGPPASTAVCVILSSVTGVVPSLEPDWVLVSTFVDEFVVTPTLRGEGVC